MPYCSECEDDSRNKPEDHPPEADDDYDLHVDAAVAAGDKRIVGDPSLTQWK